MSADIEDDDNPDSEDDHEMSLSDEGLDDLVDDDDGELDEAEEAEAVTLDPRERAARSLEIRRAIEARLEERRMQRDLDYLDLDLDGEE